MTKIKGRIKRMKDCCYIHAIYSKRRTRSRDEEKCKEQQQQAFKFQRNIKTVI